MEAFHGWRSSGDDEDDDKEACLTELVDDSSTSNQGYALLLGAVSKGLRSERFWEVRCDHLSILSFSKAVSQLCPPLILLVGLVTGDWGLTLPAPL